MNNRIKTLLREQLQTIGEEMTGGFRAYHGTETKIEKFTDEFVGGKDAIDQNGPGIYFTSTHDEAMRYTSNEGGFIYSVRLESGKYLDSEERSIEYLSQYRDDLVKLVKMAPEWEMNAYDWSQDPETGVEIMVDSAIEYNDNEKDVFLQIWIEAYRHKEVHFVRNMSKLGYSGIFVPADKANNNGNHIIVFNPATITVENVEVIGSETNETITEIDKFPISDPPMYGDSNYKSRNGKIIQMRPQDYLSLVPQLELDDASEENIEDLAGMMKQGVEIDPPTLYLDGTQVDNHDGRHRVYAAMRLGLKMVPVLMLDINGNEPQLKGLKKQQG